MASMEEIWAFGGKADIALTWVRGGKIDDDEAANEVAFIRRANVSEANLTHLCCSPSK